VNHGRIFQTVATKDRRADAGVGVRVHGGLDEKFNGNGRGDFPHRRLLILQLKLMGKLAELGETPL